MIKQWGFVAGTLVAGMALLGGTGSATEISVANHPVDVDQIDHNQQVGLVNIQNLDAVHNLNAVVGVCNNNINVLGVQVPVQDSLNGIGIPLLSPGASEATGANPENCASGGIEDGGTLQGN